MALFRYTWWWPDDLAVQVRYRPCMGNDWPNGKGIRCKLESEGSPKQTAGLTNREIA